MQINPEMHKDHSNIYDDLHRQPTSHQLGQKEALGEDWRGYWIAGIRETFEESGLMLAYQASGEYLGYDDESWGRYQDYRNALHEGNLSLAQICDKEGLKLAIDHIHFYNRWITPQGRPRRFDTRFFIAEAPVQQFGVHDGAETVDSLWISPKLALERHEQGEFGMMAVTQKQLSDLAKYETVNDVLKMARENKDFPTYKPSLPPDV